MSPLQGVDTSVPDVPRGNKVRLSDAQRDCVCHLLQDIKKLADTRRLDPLDLLIQNMIVIHVKIYSLSSGSWGRNTKCFSLYFFKIK